MDAIETIKHCGYTIEIWRDEILDSPRDWDNLGVIYAWHRRYNLADDEVKTATPGDVQTLIKAGAIALPVYLYDHSILALDVRSFIGRAHHAEWDSGQVGWIVATREKILEEFSTKRITKKIRAQVIQTLTGEIETYNAYLQGRVYGYDILDSAGDVKESCGGFYPENGSDTAYVISEAKSVCEHLAHVQNTPDPVIAD